jgi:hypothetical protein
MIRPGSPSPYYTGHRRVGHQGHKVVNGAKLLIDIPIL